MPPIGDLLAQITGEQPKPSTPLPVAPPKRKADNELQRSSDKIVRRGPPAATPPRVATQVRKSSAVEASVSKSAPHRQSALSTASRTSASKSSDTQPTSGPSKEDAVKVHKKGSYAEIMARAKAAQTTMAQVGKIQHKRIEKAPSKREREEMRSAGKITSGKAKAKGPAQPLRDGRNGTRENGKGSRLAVAEAEKKVKKAAAATTGYTGTARPNPATIKKAPPQSYGSSSRDRDRPSNVAPSKQRYTYAGSDEDEEEDYQSDGSSDMEAAVFEVDQEEERAAKLARKEDALALAEENRLKIEKERRKRLATMARNRS